LLLVHDDRLLRIVDRWLGEVAAEQFDEVLPLLRRTFGAFADPERRAIGERAAALTGAVPAARVADGIDEKRAELVIPVFARLLGVSA